MSQCRAKAVSYRLRQCVAPDLFLVLAAGCLLLFVASSVAVSSKSQDHHIHPDKYFRRLLSRSSGTSCMKRLSWLETPFHTLLEL
jgi:hypothetical protein